MISSYVRHHVADAEFADPQVDCPLHDLSLDDLSRRKAEGDSAMREIAATENRLRKAIEDAAITAIASLPVPLRMYFEAGNCSAAITRTALVEKLVAHKEAIADELERRAEADDD